MAEDPVKNFLTGLLDLIPVEDLPRAAVVLSAHTKPLGLYAPERGQAAYGMVCAMLERGVSADDSWEIGGDCVIQERIRREDEFVKDMTSIMEWSSKIKALQ